MLRTSIHRRGVLIHHTIENVFLSATTLLITLLTLLILFLGVFVTRAG